MALEGVRGAGTKSDGGAVGGSGAKMKRRLRRRVAGPRLWVLKILVRPKWLLRDQLTTLPTLRRLFRLNLLGISPGEKPPASVRRMSRKLAAGQRSACASSKLRSRLREQKTGTKNGDLCRVLMRGIEDFTAVIRTRSDARGKSAEDESRLPGGIRYSSHSSPVINRRAFLAV